MIKKKKMNHQTALLFNGALSASSVFFNRHLFMQFSLMKTNFLTNGEEEIAITFLKMK